MRSAFVVEMPMLWRVIDADFAFLLSLLYFCTCYSIQNATLCIDICFGGSLDEGLKFQFGSNDGGAEVPAGRAGRCEDGASCNRITSCPPDSLTLTFVQNS